MKIEIEINNKTQSPMEDEFFAKVAKETLEKSGYDFLAKKNISISVALVGEDEIRELNAKYRKNDDVTDILSFCEYEAREELEKSQEKELFLGELILCYNDIKKYAVENKKDLQGELTNVFAHGILHLLGMEHGEEMFNLQKEICKG